MLIVKNFNLGCFYEEPCRNSLRNLQHEMERKRKEVATGESLAFKARE